MSAHYTDAILSLLKEADIPPITPLRFGYSSITPRILPMNQKTRIATIVAIAPFWLSLSSAIRFTGTMINKKHAKSLLVSFKLCPSR